MRKLPLLFCFLLLFLKLSAQETYDIIYKLNGDEMTGKITEVSEDQVKFIYKGETAVYVVKKSEIQKIRFASGRVEVINAPGVQQPAAGAPAPAAASSSRKGKIAVLPFRFLADNQSVDEEVGYLVQNEAFSYLQKHSAGYRLQDPNTTNALLLKAGVTLANVRGYTPADLCNILDVEVIVQGTINQTRGAATTYSSGSTTRNTQYNTGKNNNKTKTTTYGSGSSSTYQNYKTSVTLGLFTESGTALFSQDHTAFWNTADAYKNAIQYLLKRSPVYTK